MPEFGEKLQSQPCLYKLPRHNEGLSRKSDALEPKRTSLRTNLTAAFCEIAPPRKGLARKLSETPENGQKAAVVTLCGQAPSAQRGPKSKIRHIGTVENIAKDKSDRRIFVVIHYSQWGVN